MVNLSTSLVVLACLSVGVARGNLLTTPSGDDQFGERGEMVAAQALLIKNVARNVTIGGQELRFYDGPDAPPGSLTDQVRHAEAATYAQSPNDLPQYVVDVAVPQYPKIKTLADMEALYDLFTARLPKPMVVDNSDANFGRQRLSVKAMALRQVRRAEFVSPGFQFSDKELNRVCGPGVKWNNIRAHKSLFVEDLSTAAQWNDVEHPEKYVPNVVGFYCYNRKTQQLLPIEIRFPDTGLTYSPMDSADEWTLAKMGLSAAGTAYHQWQHMADVHATTIPIRVELMRSMAPIHPVRVLLEHHMTLDFGLEMLAMNVLLAPGSPMDQTFGWGVTGAVRFFDYQLRTHNSIERDFEADLAERGLNDIPTHLYAKYGRKLHGAIAAFVSSYVGVYYPSNAAVSRDYELQSWAMRATNVTHLKGFPPSIPSKRNLEKLLTHLVFLSTVRHHSMNGFTTWHSMMPPYGTPALRKAMPTRKLTAGETIDLMAFTVPVPQLHVVLGLAATFVRALPLAKSLPEAYDGEPFASEPRLQPAIAQLKSAMKQVDAFIVNSERGEPLPFEIMRPSNLPVNEWI